MPEAINTRSRPVTANYTERQLLELLLEQSEKVSILHKAWWEEKVTAHKRDKLHEYLRAVGELDRMSYNIKQLLK